jgi:hypothetical protein
MSAISRALNQKQHLEDQKSGLFFYGESDHCTSPLATDTPSCQKLNDWQQVAHTKGLRTKAS